jgi:hypothetical protein
MHFLNREETMTFVRERSELFDKAGDQNPFSTSAWILHFLQNVARDDWKFFIPEAYVGGESIMLLYSESQNPHTRSALTNYYASLYSLMISSSSDRNTALRHLILQLVQLRPRCAVLNFAPIAQEDFDEVSLRQVFFNQGWYTKKYFCFGNWYLPCAGLKFEEYMKQRPSQTYNTWLRKRKKFHEKKGARLEIITDVEGATIAMELYQTVYAKSWKKPEPYPNFISGWARICAENGWLRLGIAWIDDVAIAVQFWFTINRRAYIFKLAYDEDYSRWSAGTILSAHMIKYSLEEDQVIEIDYLTGDDNYKQAWMTHRRERVGVIACNLWNARGLATAATEYIGDLRRRWRQFKSDENNHG